MTKDHRRIYFSVVLLLAVFFVGLGNVRAQEQKKIEPASRTVVRVGWFESSFNHKDKSGHRSGYGYEYQCRIAANTGWTYEYVEATWVELFEMLQRGEIDLLADVTKTAERSGQMLFSDTHMGTEEFNVLALAENKEIVPGNPSTLAGKRVAVFSGTVQEEMLRQYIAENRINMQVVPFRDSEQDMLALLQSKQVDAIIVTSNFVPESREICMPIVKMGAKNYYFAINKNRPDLKQQLDEAIYAIKNNNIYYNRDLHQKYFSNMSMFNHLSAQCEDWLDKHGTIRIGYRDNYLPFCAQDSHTGEVMGLLKDFIESSKKHFGVKNVKIEAVAYPTINDAMAAVKKGEVDLAFPSGLSVFESERERFLSTEPIVTSTELAVIRSGEIFNRNGNSRVAINAENPNYLSLLAEDYPDWEVVNFPSTFECLKGVARQQADLLLISNYRLGVLDNYIEDLGLKVVATGAEIPLSFVTNAGNSELFAIMCHLTRMMPPAEIQASLARYSVDKKVTLKNFVTDNYALSLFIVAVIFTIFAVLLYRSIKSQRKAKYASRAKSQFLFNMSHDIRTPMKAIIGYSDLMANSLDDRERSEDYLSKIRSSSRFLLGLINNVLEMARIESGKVELKEEPMMCGTVVSDICDIYAEVMRKKNITLTYESHIETKNLYIDETKVREILLNLISNAYKYTPAGGSVKLATRELPSDTPGKVKIITSVSDTGMGMSKEFLPTIFDQFTREKTSTENKVTGTGLGLAIVKKLVDLMGGTITVESEVGKGTTFTVELEHRIADIEDTNGNDKEESNGWDFTGKRVLLAEDNDLNAEIAIEVLKDHGFEVDRAEDGLRCVEMMEEAPVGTYDIILMDIQMPRMNGYEATDKIRRMADERKAFVPIVAMTANAFAVDKMNAIDAGMNAHVAKPIDVAKLMTVIDDMIG